MAHDTMQSGYARFVERLNKFPQGAPPATALFHILSILMDEHEAGRMALLPLHQLLAGEQMKSRYLDVLLRKHAAKNPFFQRVLT